MPCRRHVISGGCFQRPEKIPFDRPVSRHAIVGRRAVRATRPGLNHRRIRGVGSLPSISKVHQVRLDGEKTQCPHSLIDAVLSELPFPKQVSLILADVLGAQCIG